MKVNQSTNPLIKQIKLTPELESLRKISLQENMERRIKFLEPIGIYIDFVKPVIFKGKKIWALRSRLYPNRPPDETFHEFIISILCQVLGEDWRLSQSALPTEEQHFIYQCYVKYIEWRNKNRITQNKTGEVWSAIPDGWTQALLSLSFDISSLVHTEHMPEVILNRLKNKDQYQGARYEIAIPAIFGRLGYKINFLDEQSLTTTHPEFIAEDRTTREEIAVEAKSKIREGVLHTHGNPANPETLLWGDIQRLYRHALKQNPGNLPFIIFIDLNSPPTPDIPIQDKPWLKDIKKMIDKAPLFDLKNPDPCTAIVFTNYSYHYQTENEALPGEHLLIWPKYPKYPVKNTDFLNHLEQALSNYGRIPNLDTEIDL